MDDPTHRTLRAFAQHYGRSLNSEILLAIEALMHQHALAMLEDPETRRELGAR